MKSFSLDPDEFCALVAFLNAKALVGMNPALFSPLTEHDLPSIMSRLNSHGWMSPGDRPGTWHINEDLLQAIAVATSPQVVIMARSTRHQKAELFYLADDEIVEVVVAPDRVVVERLSSLVELASHGVAFLRGLRPCEIIVARVKGEGFDRGHRAECDEADQFSVSSLRSHFVLRPWDVENVLEFVRVAVGELEAGVRITSPRSTAHRQ